MVQYKTTLFAFTRERKKCYSKYLGSNGTSGQKFLSYIKIRAMNIVNCESNQLFKIFYKVLVLGESTLLDYLI